MPFRVRQYQLLWQQRGDLRQSHRSFLHPCLTSMVKGVAELCRRRLPAAFPRIIRASFICTKDNLALVPDFIRLCEENSALTRSSSRISTFTVCQPSIDCASTKMIRKRGTLSTTCCTNDFGSRSSPPRLFQRDYNRRPCIMPFRALIIDGDGSIALAVYFKNRKRWGNALQEPDIWNGPTMVNMRQRMLDLTRPLPDACLDCFGSFGV